MVVKRIIDDVFPSIWPLICFISLIIITLRIVSIAKNNKKFVLHKEILSLIFVIYILCLYYIVTKENIGNGLNFIPIKGMFKYKIGTYNFYHNILENILLFIPFGFFVSRYLTSRNIGRPLLVSIIVTTGIEVIEYYLHKSFNINDIILSILGSICGYLIYVALSAIRSKLPDFMKSDWFINLVIIIIIILVTLFSFNINIFSYL